MIKYVIFDLDDTLCDYQSAKRRAVQAVGRRLEGALGTGEAEAFWTEYHGLEPILFQSFLDQKISLGEYRFSRFHEPLKGRVLSGADDLAEACNRLYMEIANHEIELFGDVPACFALLKARCVVPAVMTNGPADGQTEKFHALSLHEHIPHFFTGEALGAAKPDAEAFHRVIERLSCERGDVLMVGDSLRDDFYGAQNAGLSAVLLDRENQHGGVIHNKIQGLDELGTYLI